MPDDDAEPLRAQLRAQEERVRDLLYRESVVGGQRDALQAAHAAALDTIRRQEGLLTNALHERNTARAEADRRAADLAHAAGETQRVTAEHARVCRLLDAESAGHAEAGAERDRVAARLAAALAEVGRVAAEQERACQERDRLAADLARAAAGRDEAAAGRDQLAVELQRVASAHARACAERDAESAGHAEAGAERDRVATRLAAALAEVGRVAAEHQRACRLLDAESAAHAEAGAERDRLMTELGRVAAEHARVCGLLDAESAAHVRVAAEAADTRAELHQVRQVVADREAALVQLRERLEVAEEGRRAGEGERDEARRAVAARDADLDQTGRERDAALARAAGLDREAERYRRLQGLSLRLAELTQAARDRVPWLVNGPKAVARAIARPFRRGPERSAP